MIQISDRRLWIAAGALGAALLMGGTAVLSQVPARTTAPAAHRTTLSQQPAAASGSPARPASVYGVPEEQVAAPAAAPPSLPAGSPANQAQPGPAVAPAPDRCMAVMAGQGRRPLPMCAPLAPQP